MQKLRKILLVSFASFLSIVLLLTLTFFISPKPTIQFFKLISNKKDYISKESELFLNIEPLYTINKDIAYNSNYSNGRLDIYTPNETAQSFPTILWIHGGTYVTGDKSQLETYLPFLAKEGYVVISINYELAPHIKFPNPIRQITEAYEYLYKNASDYQIDLDNFFIGGNAVGAEMASQFINVQENESYSKLLNVKQVKYPINIKGAILYYSTFEVETLKNINELTKVFFNHMKWAYLGLRKWETDEYLNSIDVINNIDSFPPTYITDVTKPHYAREGKRIAKVLNVKTTFFPNDIYKKEYPFNYQFYLNGKDNDEDIKLVALENFNKTLKFLEDLTNQ